MAPFYAVRVRGQQGPEVAPWRLYVQSMTTLSLEPGTHPQRRAAIGAHALRQALAAAGLLDDVPEVRGEVEGETGMVNLGKISASTALALAAVIKRGTRRRAR